MKKSGAPSNTTTTTNLPAVAKPTRRPNAAAGSAPSPAAATGASRGKAQTQTVKLPSIASPTANKAKPNGKAPAEPVKASTTGDEGPLSAEKESQSTPLSAPGNAQETPAAPVDPPPVTPSAEPPLASDSAAQTSESSTTQAEQPAVAVAAAVVKNGNGTVKLIYEQYDELFAIADGSTTQEQIDEVYCLSFVMPGCKLRLSALSPADKRRAEEQSSPPLSADIYVPEQPEGVFRDLEADGVCYVYVEQEAERLARDQAEMRRVAAAMEGAHRPADKLSFDDGRAMESCSCIYGNPCVDEYGCKDWSNRFAVATKNGWKGF